jgi:3-hydroxybutyryl-CoA dehydrogenase
VTGRREAMDPIEKITVIGTGVMGPDISLGFAMAGYQVLGLDLEQAILDRAAEKVASNCRQLIEGGMIDEQAARRIRSRISFTVDWDKAVREADYITEAVPEELETKREVFKRCDRLCSPNVVVASNTSSISITEISSSMSYPERAISTHWTIPAHLSPMVEIICGAKTATGTRDIAFGVLRRANKFPVSCTESPGFIHNYVQLAMVKAALDLVESGVAKAEDVDTVIKNGFGLRLSSVGPIEFVDMCGLDTVLNVQRYMFEKTGNPIYKPSRILEEKLLRNELGVKGGKGFYEYSGDPSQSFWERTNRNIIRILKAVRTS